MSDVKAYQSLLIELNRLEHRWKISMLIFFMIGLALLLAGFFSNSFVSKYLIEELLVTKPVLIAFGASLFSYSIFNWKGNRELLLLKKLKPLMRVDHQSIENK